jgi:hypothetical protein
MEWFMIKYCFIIVTAFWILSPVAFSIGWCLGIWRTPYDWAIGLVLSAVSTLVVCLNYKPEEDR